MGMIHTYPDKCRDTIKGITSDRKDIVINKRYEHKNGFIWYINSKGYYHIWKFEKVKSVYIAMVHYRLTDKDMLHEIEYKLLPTKEKAIEFYKSLLEE